MKYDLILVGAGLFNAVIAQKAVEAGKKVLVIEKRNTIVFCEKFIPTGSPRNDLFFQNYSEETRRSLLSKMQLDPCFSYILYAPTFRGKSFRKHEGVTFDIDFCRIITAAEKRFGKKFKILSGFLYTPDFQYYLEERSFYTPIETWPFDFSESLDGLIALVEKYDEKKASEKINNHLSSLGSYETGHASEMVAEYLEL